MVAYHRPIPDRKLRDGKAGSGGMLNTWVQAEKLFQIAMMLPSAGFIGWLAGYGLDRWLHQAWIGIVGAVAGILAGLVAAVRLAMTYGDTATGASDNSGKDAGSPDTTENAGKSS